MKKLSLRKETVLNLSDQNMTNVIGGTDQGHSDPPECGKTEKHTLVHACPSYDCSWMCTGNCTDGAGC